MIIILLIMLFAAFFVCQCIVRQNKADKAIEDMEQEAFVTAYTKAKKDSRRRKCL